MLIYFIQKNSNLDWGQCSRNSKNNSSEQIFYKVSILKTTLEHTVIFNLALTYYKALLLAVHKAD